MIEIQEVLNKAWDDGYKFATTLGLTGKSKKSFELWKAEILASLDPWVKVEDGLPEKAGTYWVTFMVNGTRVYSTDLWTGGEWMSKVASTFTHWQKPNQPIT